VLRKIISSGKLLQGIIDDILDFSKIEAGKLTIENQPLDLNEVLEHVIDLVREQAESKGLLISLERAADLPAMCMGDSLRLRQILMNLLSNAVKFTAQGQVILRASRLGCQLRFSVEDSGIGMDEEQLSRLFRPFEQADGSITRKYGGTGLGLVISKRLADMMQGEIIVESSLGQGSCFEVLLPLVDVPVQRVAVNQLQMTDVSGLRLSGITLLVAEDNEINQLILEENLTCEGARLVLVSDGQQAVEVIAAAAPDEFDLVLMDVMMPVLDGYQATQQITTLRPGLPVIGQTAHVLGEEREACFSAGMIDHIAKPIDPEELVLLILKHVRPAPAH
jgi:CheY-like chemotaxis protein/anti-sigma regulatory factor (Ser/Thr protein kinase)